MCVLRFDKEARGNSLRWVCGNCAAAAAAFPIAARVENPAAGVRGVGVLKMRGVEMGGFLRTRVRGRYLGMRWEDMVFFFFYVVVVVVVFGAGEWGVMVGLGWVE